MKNRILLFCFLLTMCCIGTNDASGQNPDTTKGLKDHYREFFSVGVAVAPRNIQGDEARLIRKHFNSITCENVMKMERIHPKQDQYEWKPADDIAAFASANGMQMRGHTLVWHRQVPAWFFVDSNGKQISKEELLARLKEHITTVVSRYKGKIYAWDVVNEVIDDSPGKFYRDSPWLEICGEEFIERAFEYAHAADPDALLFYNDYNTEDPVKRDKICKMVKSLLDKGIPVHGIGLQGHWSIYAPDREQLRESLKQYAALGLALQITELDVSVYRPEHERRERLKDEADTFTPEIEKRQAAQYRMFFEVLREYKDALTAVTFWNLSDRQSWLDNFPVRGRKNYPLLFDKDLKPKTAYWEVVKF